MTDDDNVIPMPPHGKPPRIDDSDPLMPCNGCNTLTKRSTLNTFGARCAPCYRAYCATPQPAPLLPAKGAKDLDPKAWAKALRTREERGERLTVAQRQMWRDALKHQPATAEEEDRWTA